LWMLISVNFSLRALEFGSQGFVVTEAWEKAENSEIFDL